MKPLSRRVQLFVLAGLTMSVMACKSEEKPVPRPHREGSVVTLTHANLEYIRTAKAETPPMDASRSLFARVAFDERKLVALGAPVSGRVVAVHVTTGDSVKAGSPLLTIHSTDLAAINAEVAEARHSRQLAEQVATRAQSLFAQGAGSQAELDQAQTALNNAREEERRAQQARGALGTTTGDAATYVLKSPADGNITERNVAVGNAVTADQGEPLLTIGDLSKVWVIVDVYEQDLPYVKVGNRATVAVAALRNRSYEAKIAYVSDTVDPESRTARARIELSNEDHSLRPGMFARVDVHSAEAATAWVPTSAVLARRDEFFVFVETQSGRFESRKVEVGEESSGHMTILSGLAPGETVVVRGAILLDAEANAAF